MDDANYSEYIKSKISNKTNLEAMLKKAQELQNEIAICEKVIEEKTEIVKSLKSNPNYKTPKQIQSIKNELKDTEELMAAFKDADCQVKNKDKGIVSYLPNRISMFHSILIVIYVA